MRIGGPILTEYAGGEAWARTVREKGYRASPCPIDHRADESAVSELVQAVSRHDVVISEVGAWSNPVSSDREVAAQAIAYAKQQLDLAERVGAHVCVNITGSRGEQWDGPHPDNFSEETFALIVDTVRGIIDGVKPKRTFYALEMMPWAFPDSADSYLRLIQAIDRQQLAAHFDPVNIVSSPRTYFDNGRMIQDFTAKLGPYIRSCHAKDSLLRGKLTVHLDEVLPGTGRLDYRVFLSELNKLDADIPLIIEHLKTDEEYRQAFAYIRGIADELGIQ